MLHNCIIVLHNPREVVNIGAVVRAMKNMGLRQLRLVQPPPFTRDQITALAHRGDDLFERITTYATLDEALADTTFVVGTSARPHSLRAMHYDLRGFAPTLVAQAMVGSVAIVFGPEDNGLDNAALDRCHATLHIPTEASYTSLNLAQAALLVMYELRLASELPLPNPPTYTPAEVAQLEALFATTQRALDAIAFFKSPATVNSTISTLRQIVHRALLDPREAALLIAIAREVERIKKL